MTPEPTGTFPLQAILLPHAPRPPEGVVDALAALDGLACLVSDVLDDLGIGGVIPASRLRPVIEGRRILGPAVTLRKARIAQTEALRNGPKRGDLEVHNRTLPGDVLVIQGFDDVSNLGGLSALTSQRQGALGAVIWGGCRDLAELRRIGYPAWSSAVTPVTGVGRIDGVEINGPLDLGGVAVQPGDLVLADDDGICVIPRARAAEVLARAQARAASDARREAQIRQGVSLQQLAGRTPG